MNKIQFTALFIFFAIPVLFGLEVDRSEIKPGSAGDSITFINYSGPYSVISSVEEINGIGTSLGKGIAASGSSGDPSRYYVIHAVDTAVKTGFDADILILGEKAGVDHIDNLRRIISSYLSAAYGYSAKDSATLATFITIYNAVYRGKIDVFQSRYKPVVMKNLSPDKAGLSVRYDEWPGKTQIVIPLSDPRLAGTVSSIDTTSLTDKAVVEKIKEDSTTATDTRKAMTELKTKEGDAAQARADSAKQDAAQTRTDEAKKQADLASAQKEADATKAAADTAAKTAKENPDNQAAQAKAAETQKVADQKAAAVTEKKTELAATQEKAATAEATAQADQKLADTKQKEAQTENKEIASDTQKQIDQKDAQNKTAGLASLASALPATGLKIVDDQNFLGEPVIVNLNDGSIMKTSTLNTIRGRILYDTGSGLLAIAGKKGGNAAIKLVLLDPATLEITKQGADSIAENSLLVQNANDYYAVIETDSGAFVLGRFDKNLEAKAKSAIEVKPYTAITVTEKGLLVQDKSGAIKLIRASDLTVQ